MLTSWTLGRLPLLLCRLKRKQALGAQPDRLLFAPLFRFSKNEWSKIVALLGLTLALIYLGGLGLYTISNRPMHEAFWEVMPFPVFSRSAFCPSSPESEWNLLQAVAGAGFDWKFSEEAVDGGFLMRVMSVMVSVGGMLITALLLGIVSGGVRPPACLPGSIDLVRS